MGIKYSLFSVFVFTLTLFYIGCVPPQRDMDHAIDWEEAPVVETNFLGRSVEGRDIEYTRLGSVGRTSLVIGAIHGSEPASAVLARKLVTKLKNNPQIFAGHQIIVVPVINPDGLAAGTRGNARGVDLNRNFPAANRKNTPKFGMKGFSEPESRALGELQRKYEPSVIISIHQPLACIDYDGPGKEIAEAMAEYCDLPVRKLGARPGSYGSYAGVESNIPIITFEMRRNDELHSPERIWEMYGKALLAGIYYPEEPVSP